MKKLVLTGIVLITGLFMASCIQISDTKTKSSVSQPTETISSSGSIQESIPTNAPPKAENTQDTPPAGQQAPAASPNVPQGSDEVALTQDEAKKIALDTAGVSEEQTSYLNVGFEYDDNMALYKVSFVVDTTEYDFEIDANTGAVVEYDSESIYD